MDFSMPQKPKAEDDGYKTLGEALASGKIGCFYIFHGEERYLLESGLAALRKALCPEGLDSFNYKRFDGRTLTITDLDDAINTLPAFAERTLVEVHDFDIFKGEHNKALLGMFSDLPEYVCIVFIYDTIAYKPDGRLKINAGILKIAEVIAFSTQEEHKLIKWIQRHYADNGKQIALEDAKYLSFITGGHMTSLIGEIAKTSAYAINKTVTRADIDAVVTPILDATVYNLSDALTRGDHTTAMALLEELFQMREAPHRLMFSISLTMRRLLAARVCLDSGYGRNAFMDMSGIKKEYPAKLLMDAARRMSTEKCRDFVLHCSDTAHRLNSVPEPEGQMIELIARLALS